jgi:hypothetical protein
MRVAHKKEEMVKLRSNIFFDLGVLLFFAFLVWEAKDWRLQARLFPWAIGIPMLFLAMFQLVTDLKRGGGTTPGSRPVDFQFTREIDPLLARRRTIVIFCWIFGFCLGVWLVGFSVSIPIVVFLYLKVQTSEGWALSLSLTAAAWLIYWGLFEKILLLPLPEGQLFLWIGS